MKSIRKQERKYFVHDLLESGIRPGKLVRVHVGDVYAKNEEAALHKARTIFSSTATVSTKYPSASEYYEQEVKPREDKSRFSRGDWMEEDEIPSFLR